MRIDRTSSHGSRLHSNVWRWKYMELIAKILINNGCELCFIENPTRKLIIMRFGVFMLLTSGILLSCISIFYAHFIKREFHWYEAIPDNVVNTDFIKFEYGGCVYAAFILSLLNYILVFFLFKVSILPLIRCGTKLYVDDDCRWCRRGRISR